MRRFSIICRYGLDDKIPVSIVEPESCQAALQLVSGRRTLDHGIGETLSHLQRQGLFPSEIAFDLLVLASVVYCADIRINRAKESQDNWTREIDIYLPVSNTKRWEAVSSSLSSALEFLTGDKWRFFFRARPEGFESIVARSELRFSNLPASVCLFSGGLDSFIGAIDLLENKETPLLVGHGRVPNVVHDQTECLNALRRNYGLGRVRFLKSPIGFDHGIIAGAESENTERSRSFLFFSLAALGASTLKGKTTVYVPENGLISLNVPLDPLRLGSLSTRTTHPFFMARFNDLLGSLGIRAHLLNPYRHKTKGEMVRECQNQNFLADNAPLTMSCSSPTKGRWKHLASAHCGHCVPCLIRKAAFVGWQKGDNTQYHLADLRSQVLDPARANGECVRSIQLALRRLNNDINRAKILVHTAGPLTDFPDEIPAFARVYLAGMQEVAQLLDGVEVLHD